ncbi:MAG TPA: hypothetical protein VMY80_00560 [Anaerolineae bacterium]|nr:hypothetical protein [Anaerolineae bacterium]
MKGKALFNLVPALGLVLALGLLMTGLPGAAGAQGVQPQAVLGGAFTYQGRLVKDGHAVTGTCAFQFSLWDAGSGGHQIGNTQTVSSVSVSDGYFSVLLNDADEFGSGAFTGDERYLQIAVKCSGDSTFVLLGGRAALSAAPYALHARSAPWSGLAGVPAGFADGVDNGGDYQNVIVVAKSGGDFTSIQAALNSIADNSEANRYLVWVAPGTYTETVTMKPYVDIEGSGELTTRITASIWAPLGTSALTGTVVGADHAEMRLLTVENSVQETDAVDIQMVAIYNNNASPRLTHVTVIATDQGNNYSVITGMHNNDSSPTLTHVTITVSGGFFGDGVHNYSSSPTMAHVTITASGAEGGTGVANEHGSSPVMTHVTATASFGESSRGVYNDQSSPTMTDVTATASGSVSNVGVLNDSSSPEMTRVTAIASAAYFSTGVSNNSSSPTMTHVTVVASGTESCYGIYNNASSPTIQYSTINASGGTQTGYGIYNEADSGSYTVKIDHSEITSSLNTIVNDAEFTTRVGASQLAGRAVVTGGGTVTCAGVYDENYAFRASTCP